MRVEVNNNLVSITNNEGKTLHIESVNKRTYRIYFEKVKTDLIDLFIKDSKEEIIANSSDDIVTLATSSFKFIVDNNFKISLYKGEKLFQVVELNSPFDEFEKKNYSEVSFHIDDSTKVYGLGDKMASLDKKGYWFRSWNTDDSNHQDELFPSLYKSINYMLIRNNGVYFSTFFPSTFPYTFDVAKSNLTRVTANSFDVGHDFFLFLGDSIKEITGNYSYLCGHPYFVRLKMLGYQQSRRSYEDENMVLDVFNKFKENDLPLDYIHLDIHYLDGYRDYTVDKTRFPNMKSLSDTLKAGGVEIVAINDAAIKVDEEFDIYKHLETNKQFGTKDGETYINVVWPGDSAFPNYLDKDVKKYLTDVAYKFVHENGISGIWNDMNEPASFKGELPLDVDFSLKDRKIDHKEAHNVYGEHMVKDLVNVFKKDNLRPYLFSRAAFATTPKYAFVWNGDNFSLWHHLRYSISQNLSLSLSNFMFNGVDIGGFGGDGNKEILIRWLEANLFMPFLRNHSSLHTLNQEPYAFDTKTVQIYKKYLEIRYKFIPYLYDLTYRMNKKGELIVRPLFYNYQDDEVALDINDEYMVGESLLVAPILNKDEKYRCVYLPKGTWIDYFTGKEYKGNKKYIFDFDIDQTGYFIKKNSIIPMYENLKHIEKDEIDTLVLHVYGTKGKYELYEDDGKSLDYEKGIYNIYQIAVDKDKFTLKTKHHKYDSTYKKIKLIYQDHTYEIAFNYDIEFKF